MCKLYKLNKRLRFRSKVVNSATEFLLKSCSVAISDKKKKGTKKYKKVASLQVHYGVVHYFQPPV